MVVDYLSSQLDWAGYQVSTKWGSGPVLGGEIDRLKGGYECLCVHFASWAAFIKVGVESYF